MEEIIVKRCRFKVYESGNFIVAKYEDKNTHKNFTAVGNNLPLFSNAQYKFVGEWQESSKYKRSFKVEHFEIYVEKSLDSIVGFLSCGIFPFMGLKTAQRVYDTFGDDTIEILNNDINRLLEIKGFSKKKLKKFKPIWESENTKKELANFLLKYNIPTSKLGEVEAVYADIMFPEDMKERILCEPYILSRVKGITLPIVNTIVDDNNLPKVSLDCLKAYVLDILKKNEVSYGDTVMYAKDLIKRLNNLLSERGFTNKNIVEYLIAMIKKGTDIYCLPNENGEKIIGRKCKIDEELSISASLTCIQRDRSKVFTKKDVDEILEDLKADEELKADIEKLDETQMSAIYSSMMNKAVILTGGGGTGKTTVTKIIAECFANQGINVICLAPTGRASRRLEEVTGRKASTIHHFFKLGVKDVEDENEDFVYASDKIFAENSLVIVDEASMIDVAVCKDMLEHIKSSCFVLFVGDIDQLPSVGCGAVLRDMIESQVIPTIRLETVYRQKEGSVINLNAQKIKKGNKDITDGNDFHFIECKSEDLENSMLKKVLEMDKKYGEENVMCLCPYKENLASTRSMNNLLQEALNPKGKDEKSVFVNDYDIRVNDIVMQTSRNLNECSNGDIGIVRLIDTNDRTIKVDFPLNNSSYTYEADEVNDLILAYASTIHKAQGSEALAVVTCIADFHKYMLKRNFLYTDVSRARKEIWIYGNRSALETAIDTVDTYKRKTTLKGFLSDSLGKKDKDKKDEYEQLSFINLLKEKRG